MLHLCFSLFVRSVSACGHRLQTGHRSSGGRHCQSDHSSDPQPRCQQQISRHLQHPVHTGHLSLTSNQPSSNTTQLILCLDSADSDYSCLFSPSGNPGKQPAFRNCQQDKLGGLGWKVRLETLFLNYLSLHTFHPTHWQNCPLVDVCYSPVIFVVVHFHIFHMTSSVWLTKVLLCCVSQWTSRSKLLQGQTDGRLQHQQVTGHFGHRHICTW